MLEPTAVSDVVHDVQPDLRQKADLFLVILYDRYEAAQEESRYDGRHVGRHFPVLRIEEAAQVKRAVLWVDVLFNKVVDYQGFLSSSCNFSKLATELEETHDLANVVPFTVVVSILF